MGSGDNADVEFQDFRQGALYEARLISPDGSSGKGGNGYLIRQGSAQETLGASSTIKLSQNDPTQQYSEIQGMRIVITDGTGSGQYGYISSKAVSLKDIHIVQRYLSGGMLRKSFTHLNHSTRPHTTRSHTYRHTYT